MGILLFLLSYLFFVDPVTSSAGSNPTYTEIPQSLLNWFWDVPQIKALGNVGYDCHYTSAPGSSNPCHASFYVAEKKCFGLYVDPNTAQANWQTTEDDKKKQLGGKPKIDATVEKQLVYETMRHYFNNGGAMTDIGKKLFSKQQGGLDTKYNSVMYGDMIPKVKGDSVDLSNIIPKPASSSSSSSKSGGVQGMSLDEHKKKIGKENGQETNQQSETNKLHSQKMDTLVDLIFGGEKRIDRARFFEKFTGIPEELVKVMWDGCNKINDELPVLNFKMWLATNWKAEETSELGTAIDAILTAGNKKGKKQKRKAEISATFANNAIPTAMMLPMVVFSVTLTVFYVYYTLPRKDEVHISLLDENYYA